ncbi:hypothetical protein CO046_04325 [Candidatus Peregrinibacteria bacterium CG_4_9_14_0_2_um_filter_53_11]|nr:MAG: hypothetical protein CO046_04325 [Candidatus Peregrinibacteria bacterium CG_4_9_14_0_2_um_filter_53_11]
MRTRLVEVSFVSIGLVIGVILALQIGTTPVYVGSYPLDQIEVQKQLLTTFSTEQEQLKRRLEDVQARRDEVRAIIERHSSPQLVEELGELKSYAGFDTVSGHGVRITLNDKAIDRINYTSLNQYFVQAADLRDLMNALFLQDAQAISINGRRVLPLTAVQSAFDTIFVGNLQISAPFVVEAVGNPEALKYALTLLPKKEISIYTEDVSELTIAPQETLRPLNYLSLTQQ